MARLIIGHVTDSSAKVWVRGTAEYPFAFVTVNGPGAPKPERVTLEKRHFYTGVADIPGLKAHAEYECMVR